MYQLFNMGIQSQGRIYRTTAALLCPYGTQLSIIAEKIGSLRNNWSIQDELTSVPLGAGVFQMLPYLKGIENSLL